MENRFPVHASFEFSLVSIRLARVDHERVDINPVSRSLLSIKIFQYFKHAISIVAAHQEKKMAVRTFDTSMRMMLLSTHRNHSCRICIDVTRTILWFLSQGSTVLQRCHLFYSRRSHFLRNSSNTQVWTYCFPRVEITRVWFLPLFHARYYNCKIRLVKVPLYY